MIAAVEADIAAIQARRAARVNLPPPTLSKTIIQPAKGWRAVDFGELWRYRELVVFLAWRDIAVRYKQTALGASWALIQPFLMMVVFSTFFGKFSGSSAGGVPYPLYVFAGLLPWMFFASTVAGAGNSVIGSERLITKVYFPRLAIPFAVAGWAAVDLAVASTLLGAMMAWYGVAPGAGLLLMPVWFALIALTGLGVGVGLAALNVAYRDFRYVIPFLVQLWMFATPSIYMQADGLPTRGLVHAALSLNPMTPLVAAFRSSALGTPIPFWATAVAAMAAPVVFILGCLYFRKVEGEFADIV